MLICRLYCGFLRKAIYRSISLITGSVDQKYMQRDTVNNIQRIPYSKKSVSCSDSSSKGSKNESTGPDENFVSSEDSEAAALEKKRDAEKLMLFEKICMAEQRKSFAKDIESMAKSEQKVLNSMLPCLEKGMKRECKKKAKKQLKHEKQLEKECSLIAKKDKIRKLLKLCENENKTEKKSETTAEKKSETSAIEKKPAKVDPIANICLYLKLCQNTSDCSRKSDSPKDQYLMELKKSIRKEWSDICQVRHELSKSEQMKLSLAHKCVAAQIKKMCKVKVLKYLCNASEKSDTNCKTKIANSGVNKPQKCPHKEKQKKAQAQQKSADKENKVDCQSKNNLKSSKNDGIFKEEQQNKKETDNSTKMGSKQKAAECKSDTKAPKKESVEENKKEENCRKLNEDMMITKRDDKHKESRSKVRAESKEVGNDEEALRKKCKEASKRRDEFEKALEKMRKEAAFKKLEEQETLKKKKEEEVLKKQKELKELSEKQKAEYQKRKKEAEIFQKNCNEAAQRKRLRALKKICEAKILKKKRKAQCQEDARRKKNEKKNDGKQSSKTEAEKKIKEIEDNRLTSKEDLEAEALEIKFRELQMKCAEEMYIKKKEEKALKNKKK